MAFGVRPLLARRTIHARPCGVRRAFWCRFIRLSSRMLKLQQLQLPRLEPDGQPIESSQLEGKATVDDVDRAGGEGRFVRGEIDRQRRDLLGGAESAHRLALDKAT